MAYATAEHLRLFLRHGLAFTADEIAQAELLIELAEGAIDDELGQPLEESTDTVTLDGPTQPGTPGTGSHRLVLPRWPVTAVTSVTLLHDDAPDETLEHGADHDYTWSESGILTRIGGWWPTGDQAIQVVYTAGYATVPKGVKRAALRLAAAAWGNPELLSSETLGDHSRSWSADALGMTLSQADITALGVYRART